MGEMAGLSPGAILLSFLSVTPSVPHGADGQKHRLRQVPPVAEQRRGRQKVEACPNARPPLITSNPGTRAVRGR